MTNNGRAILNWFVLDSFINLAGCTTILHVTKKHQSSLKGYIFWVAIMRKKHKLKKEESPFSLHHKKRTKGQFWLQMIILHKRTGASFKTNIFSWVELSKSLLKALGLQKGPLLPLFRQLIKITAIFEITMLCIVYVAQCKKGNYLKLEHKHNQELTAYRLVKKKWWAPYHFTSYCQPFQRKRDVFMEAAISSCLFGPSMLRANKKETA